MDFKSIKLKSLDFFQENKMKITTSIEELIRVFNHIP